MGYYAAGDWYRSGDPGGLNILGMAARLMGPKAIPSAPARAATMAATPAVSLKQRASQYLKKAGKAGMPGGRALGKMLAGKRRRMNVLNPRALRKALRRAEGFTRFARRVVKITAPKRRVSGFRFRRRKRRAA